MMLFLSFILFLVVWMLCSHDCVKPRKFPPGPAWYPLVGAFPAFHKLKEKYYYVHTVLEEMSKKYGPVVGIKLGRQKFVVISGSELVKKTAMRDEFNGRPDGFFFRVRAFGKRKGVLFIDGPAWAQTRKSTMKHLRSFGFGQKTMENYLEVEAEALVTHLQREVERLQKPLRLQEIFDVTVLNTLWMMIAGYRFTYDDSRLNHILSVVHEAFRSSDTLGGILSHLPFLRFVIPNYSGYNRLMETHDKLWGFIRNEIDEHLKTMRRDQPPKDFIEAFLLESGNSYDREELIVLCLDLFMAGSKTTTDSLTAIFALALHHPEWIKSLQNDLQDIVGPDAQPSCEHASQLPRIEAFLAEAHRVLVLTPLGVPHRTMDKVSLEGYNIPKGTVVLFNYHSTNVDETCWEEPLKFKPDRFLDENGQFKRRSEFSPFGLGKRRCLGELLARASLFIFFSSIIHNFDIETPEDQGLPILDGIDGFTVSPRPYLIKLTPRCKRE
ncbi:probable cytochrome P450 303a1 isoform X1 [Fopius arisanus]|uniref:Probable cytochrome P450 303a1 isoform X1 n=2 Tax=Fopius arisanus TaxID=64838 RepID=A0A9R1SY32_9HYME|nr:PREDICTED: probable cytochrome P450 303a1 isoform X1 [Fopius arisanus]